MQVRVCAPCCAPRAWFAKNSGPDQNGAGCNWKRGRCMNSDFQEALWPASQIGEALLALAPGPKPPKLWTAQWTPDWIEAAARSLGIEAQPAETSYSEFESLLPKMAPAILHIPGYDSFLVLVSGLAALA